MRYRFLTAVVAIALLSLATWPASAQVTGALTGRVTHEGSPLPGVGVTISSPALQGTRTAYTDANGNYTFGALPPGTYTVRFEMQGMTTETRTTRVGLEQMARVDAVLGISAVAEAITVTAGAPAVLETTEIETNITAETVEMLPMGRTLVATANFAPGVTTTGPRNQVMISGAMAHDSLFTVNGVAVNENLRGQPHNLFIEDAIQETTIMTGAISAEYGRFTGGVVSAITKSGGNEFSGSLRDNIENPSWTADSPIDPGNVPDDLNHVQEATLGGRIIRDRLWFFAAAQRERTDDARTLSRGGLGYANSFERDRIEGKLTGQITPRHTLVASYMDSPLLELNDCQLGCIDLEALDPDVENPNTFLTAHYNGIFSSNLLFEANYAEKDFAFVGFGGSDTNLVTGTPIRDFAQYGGAVYNEPYFCGSCTPEDRNSRQFGGKLTYYLGTRAAGTHNLTAGYENWYETRLSNNFQSPTNFVIINYTTPPVRDDAGNVTQTTFDPGDIIVQYPILQSSLGSDFETTSFYVNDRWDLNRNWSFNIGARYDQNDGVDAAGNSVAKDSAVSPRLGAIWDVFGNGRLRANASFSRYVGRLADSVASSGSVAGRPAIFVWEYDGPQIVGTTQQAMTELFNWFEGIGGTNNDTNLVFTSIPGATLVVEDSLNSPSTDEWTLGVGTALGPNGYLRADYITREWGDFYSIRRDLSTGTAVANPATGALSDRGLVVNSDQFERTYDAIQLQMQYGFFNRRLNTGLNYTWSELRGNIEGETGGSGPVADTAFTYPEYQGYAQRAPIGFLNGDQTHKARAWASYDIPTPIGRFNISAVERYESGTAYDAVGTIRVTPAVTGRPNPGYATPPTTATYFFSDRGEFRWDDMTATDLALNYALPISRVNIFVQAEAFNIFNEDAVVSGDSTVFTGANAGRGLSNFDPFAGITPIECPQGAAAAECQAMGAHWQRGPNFGQATTATTSSQQGSFQLPRTYRLAVGLRF